MTMMNLFRRLRRSKQEIAQETQEINQLYNREKLLQETVPVTVTQVVKKRRPAKKKSIGKKKVKKKAKKTPVKAVKEQELFKNVIADLDNELRTLRKERRHLEERLAAFNTELGSTQSREIALRDKISGLMKKESLLMKRRSSTKDKVLALTKKIEKVSAVERQLREE